MSTVMPYLSTIAVLGVLLVLLLGLWNMMRDGSASRSQKLMRLRVGLQALAVAFIMATIYFVGRP